MTCNCLTHHSNSSKDVLSIFCVKNKLFFMENSKSFIIPRISTSIKSVISIAVSQFIIGIYTNIFCPSTIFRFFDNIVLIYYCLICSVAVRSELFIKSSFSICSITPSCCAIPNSVSNTFLIGDRVAIQRLL